MDVLEAIKSRRSIFSFKPDPVPNEVIERIFSYGRWAQNHHLTEPWRFVVIGPDTKELLAKRYAKIQRAKAAPNADDNAKQAIAEAGYKKFHLKPTIVAVSCLQDGDDTKNREDYAAVCCAMQNVALAGWAEGVGMQWTTGPVTLEEETYELLGIDKENEYIVGFMYTGYPEEIREGSRKKMGEVLRYTE
ncbi:MAG: nitroreductase [Gemmatimonadetes bacterium]|jgi:nitroreductase|nr:nitroreductase [Gemmatimonadota bacterium]HCK12027.1 nitroreductase [Candidatus Latescibacterota bacterium]